MKVWIHIDGVQEGPFELEQLPMDRITPDTPVWYDGLPQWLRACDAPAVASLLQSHTDNEHQSAPAQSEAYEPHTETSSADAATVDRYAQEARATMAQQRQAAAYAQHEAEQYEVPKGYLVWAIITTLLCCSPFSIAAIFTWGTARRRNSYGDLSGAKTWANATAWLIMIAIVFALIGMPFFLIINSI